MVDRIEFDFNLAVRQERQIEETAEYMRQTALPELQELLQEISAAWKGNNAEQFHALFQREYEEAERAAALIECAGQSLRAAINMAEETEERIKELAETRVYK